MQEGYCVKCREKREIKDVERVEMENGRKALKGVCPVCGSGTLLEIRQKLQCARCHSIVETCCEGGRG